MESNTTFVYQYSAKQKQEVGSIRRKYLPEEENKLGRLKELDSRVKTAGLIPSLCIGIVGALLFGVGMCFGLNALVGADWLKYMFGVLGTVVMLPAYPIYKYISAKTKAELTPEILKLSDELMKK
jgi:uncharacterized membrane protein YeaQ/YmgE (transglycosylase-associated protein family)